MATSQDQETRLVGFHLTAWLNGSLNEEKEQNKGMELVPSDPFRSPTEIMGNEASMRRLFLLHFSCPLCGQEHSCEMYLTVVASTKDEMMGKALETLSRDDVKVNSLAPFMKEYHQREGDYLQRAKAYAREGIHYPFEVTSLTMTDEDSYTCEYCQMKFETIGAWRRHDGRNPMNGQKLTGVEGIELCQKRNDSLQ